MSTFLHRIAPDLAISVVAGSVAGYGLHRLLPAPNGNFLISACVGNLCASNIIRTYVNETIYSYARKNNHVDKEGKINNPLFNRINLLIHLSTGILLPIFCRYLGQRLGYQVPRYLETVGYLSLSGASFWLTRTTYDILRDALYPKPAIK